MKLNNYIVASLLSHILVFGILIVLYPEIDTDASLHMFNVDIVGYIAEEDIPAETVKIPARPRPPVSRKEDKVKPPPETIFGEGAESEPSGSGKEETAGGTSFTPLEKATDKVGKDINADSGLMPPLAHPGGENSLTGFTDEEGTSTEDSKGFYLHPKNFLFDKGTIEKYARKGTTKGKGLTFDVPEFHHRGYMRRLKDKIENIWKYPKEAARRKISGDLYIRFSIRRDGSLSDVELVRTSGYKDLDNAAMKALVDAEPYWPLPPDFKEDELSITGHFVYVIGRFYIM